MDSETKARRGNTCEGKDFDPSELPDEPDQVEPKPRPAPAPGLPISDDEYDRLKEAAKKSNPPRHSNPREKRNKRKEKPQ